MSVLDVGIADPSVLTDGFVAVIDPVIGIGVPLAIPCIESTSVLELPAVPSAGCLADVAAPVGRGKDVALTG
jgi:hypothetical protein